ncbi:MAG: hypothetical protein AABW48_04475 [Nanoarchaeota archaeon]
MNKYASVIAMGLTLGQLGCASLQDKSVTPEQYQPIPIVEVERDQTSVTGSPISLSYEQEEAPLGMIADKLYNKLQVINEQHPREIIQISFADQTTGVQFTAGIHPCMKRKCLDFFLAEPGKDNSFLLAVDEYPLGSLDRAVGINGVLPKDDLIIQRAYERLLRTSYENFKNIGWDRWHFNANIKDSNLNEISGDVFNFIRSRPLLP